VVVLEEAMHRQNFDQFPLIDLGKSKNMN